MPRKIYYTPEIQAAYLKSITKGEAGGLVNPQLTARKTMGNFARYENDRLQRLETAGEDRERIQKYHDQDMQYKNKVLKMRKDELQSQKDAFPLTTALGLTRLGLGYLDSQAVRQQAIDTKNDMYARLAMQLEYLKKTDNKKYQWLINQPYIKNKLQNLQSVNVTYPEFAQGLGGF